MRSTQLINFHTLATWVVVRQANLNFFLPAQIESNYDQVTDSFDSMDLKPELLRGMCLPLLREKYPLK